MADWESLSVSPQKDGDVMSLFTTKSASPLYRMNGHVSELSFTPVKSGAAGDQQGTSFCHRDTVQQCVATINQEITTLGLPSLYTEPGGTYDLVRLVNCTYDLLTKHRQSSRIREELENREHRTKADIDHLKACQDKLKLSLEQNERDLAQQQERERQLTNKLKALTVKLKDEKDEVKRLQSSISHREQQYKHEVKKKERELVKLKERLHQHLTDKTEKRIGLELSDPLVRSDGKRGTWKTGNKQEEEMYRGMISAYEDRQKQLVVENTELRHCLKFMQHELSATLAKSSPTSFRRLSKSEASEKDKSDDVTEIDDDTSDAEVLSEAHFEMPFDVVRDDIQKSVKETVKLVQKRLERDEQKGSVLSVSSDSLSKTDSALGATAGTPLENSQVLINHTAAPLGIQSKPGDTGSQFKPVISVNQPKQISEGLHLQETDKLKKQIARYKDIIEQQESLLQEHIERQQEQTENDTANTSILQHSAVWEERESLEAREKLFQEQKANFEQERKSFTEEAVKLARERRELDAKRADVLTQEFMNLTPFREASKSADVSVSKETSPILKTEKPTSVSGSGTPVSGKALASASSESNDLSDTPNSKEYLKKPRSRRLLPATPSSTPDLNSASNSAHDAPLTTPRVMARPHSSIAISGGASSKSSLLTRVLRPRSSAPSTAELYKKLGLEPPKDRGRERERDRSSRMAKPHSTNDALERYPGSPQSTTHPPSSTQRGTSEPQRLGMKTSDSSRGASVSSSADESAASPGPGVSQSLRLAVSQSSPHPCTASTASYEGDALGRRLSASSENESPGGHVTHVQTGFKIDLPSTTEDNSSSAEQDQRHPSIRNREDLRATRGDNDRSTVETVRTRISTDKDRNTESDRNVWPSDVTSRQTKYDIEKNRKSRVAPKLGQKYADRKREYDYKSRRESDDFCTTRGESPDNSRNSSKKAFGSVENLRKYDPGSERSREDLRKSQRSREDIYQSERPRSGRGRDEYKLTKRNYDDRLHGSTDKLEDRIDRDRARDEYKLGRSRSRENDLSDKKLHRSQRRESQERTNDKERHSSHERVESRDRKYMRENSRERKHRESSKERRYGRETDKYRERSSSERSSDYNTRPRSTKEREKSKERSSARTSTWRSEKDRERSREHSSHLYSSSRDRYPDTHKYSARDQPRHSEHKRPHTARDSYFTREHSMDGGPISARGPDGGRSSLRREASFEGFSHSDRQTRDERKVALDMQASSKDRGVSQDRGALGSYLRRRSGGSFPVAALILRNPEKMDTFTKSSRKTDH